MVERYHHFHNEDKRLFIFFFTVHPLLSKVVYSLIVENPFPDQGNGFNLTTLYTVCLNFLMTFFYLFQKTIKKNKTLDVHLNNGQKTCFQCLM